MGQKIAASSPLAIFSAAQDLWSGRRAPRETSAVAERIQHCFNGGQLLLNSGERLRVVMKQSSGGVTGPLNRSDSAGF